MSLWLFYRSLRDKVNLEATMALRSDFASVANSSDGNNAELIFFPFFIVNSEQKVTKNVRQVINNVYYVHFNANVDNFTWYMQTFDV